MMMKTGLEFFILKFTEPLQRYLLKTVAFIAGKKNPADQKFYIRFSIENLVVNISFYALSWLKLNFGSYLTFENNLLSFISMEKLI